MPQNGSVLDLTSLENGSIGITPTFGKMLGETCIVCFEDQGYHSGVDLDVQGSYDHSFQVRWAGQATEQMLRCYNDEQVTTEHGAYGVAFLVVRELTGWSVIERSYKGTGFDYWIGADESDDLPFQNKARLEVSGIRRGDQPALRSRVKQKREQTLPTDGSLPAYIVVVEFSQPVCHVEVKP